MAITSFASNSGTTSTLSPTLAFGFTASAGDLIIAIVGVDSAVTSITCGGSWVEIQEGTHTGFRMTTAYLIAAGGETTGSFTGGGTGDRWEAIYIRIPAGEWHGTTPPEQNTAVTGSSTSPDPGSIAPSWGSETNNIFIAAFVGDDSVDFSVSAYPTNYSTAQIDASATTSSANLGAAVRITTAASDDPAAFTISSSETWRAVGIAVRPAASGTLYESNLTGGLSFVGSLSKRDNKALTGGLSFSGAFSKQSNKPLAGALSFVGSLVKRTDKPLTGGLSFSGLLTSSRVFLQELAGGLSFSGALTNQTGKALAGGLSFVGVQSRQTNKSLTGGLSFVGSLSKQVLRVFSGALSFSSAFSKQTNKALAGSLSFVGSIAKEVRKSLAGGLSFIGNLVPELLDSSQTFFVEFTAELTFSGSLVRSVLRAFAGDALSHPGIRTRGRWPTQSFGLRRRRRR